MAASRGGLVPNQRCVRVGPYEAHPETGELLHEGRRVPIQRQPFQLLLVLLEQPGRVFTREELYARLWPPGTFVDFEHGLNTLVRKLRRTLRDSAHASRYVVTVPGRGYRFASGTEEVVAGGSTDPVEDAFDRARWLAHPPFVGRRAEIERLESSLARASEGRGGVALVTGEPGIGKTRLLDEVAARARRHTVLAGRCAQGDASAPYEPFAEAIAGWVHDCDPARLREIADATTWAVVARLAPAVRTKLGALEEVPALRPDEERMRLFGAVAEIVRGIAKREPILILLDDLHWAEPAALALFARLARIAAEMPMLLLGAYRDVEVDQAHPLARTIDLLANEVRFESMLLTGLGVQPIHSWLDLLSQGAFTEDVADQLFRTTNGNPLFLREILLEWEREGTFERGAGPEAIVVPESVRAVIARRLARLSSEARQLLACAFARARRVLDAQGARPLRAIADYDEALMHARRDRRGDRGRTRDLLDVAIRQFEAIGMPGWTERAGRLLREEPAAGAAHASPSRH